MMNFLTKAVSTGMNAGTIYGEERCGNMDIYTLGRVAGWIPSRK
jgi:hypothetical protein